MHGMYNVKFVSWKFVPEGRGFSLAVVCVVLGDASYFSSGTAFFLSEVLIDRLFAGHVASCSLKTKRTTDF